MIRRSLLGVGVLLAAAACTKPDAMSRPEFTKAFAEAFAKAAPAVQVEVTGELELAIGAAGENRRTAFLDNAYAAYLKVPGELGDIQQRFVAAAIQAGDEEPFDRSRIVPVIKDKAWLEEVRTASAEKESAEPLDMVYEELNEELVIVYAQDSPKSLRYLSPKVLQENHLELARLRGLAAENLRALIPKPSRTGDKDFYTYEVDGTFEASLLLFDEIWKDPDLDVGGELVVAIPARDVLLVTGSKDPVGLARMRKTVKEIVATAPYRLTSKLFIRRNGKFVVWDD